MEEKKIKLEKLVAEVLSWVFGFLAVATLGLSCATGSDDNNGWSWLFVVIFILQKVKIYFREDDERGYSRRENAPPCLTERVSYQAMWLVLLAVVATGVYGLRYNVFGSEDRLVYDHETKTLEVEPLVSWAPWTRYTMVTVNKSPMYNKLIDWRGAWLERKSGGMDEPKDRNDMIVDVHFKTDTPVEYQREFAAHYLSKLSEPPDGAEFSFWAHASDLFFARCTKRVVEGISDTDALREDLADVLVDNIRVCMLDQGLDLAISEMKINEIRFVPVKKK